MQQNIFLILLIASEGMTTLTILAFRYQMVETVSASIAILLGILLIYLVLYYSPKEMGPFKYLVVNTTAADVIYSIFCFYLFEPVPLFPAFSGICLGLFRYLGRRFCFYGFVVFVLFFGYTNISLTLCFFYRYLILSPTSTPFISLVPIFVRRYFNPMRLMASFFILGLTFISFPMIFLILGEETDYETVKNYTGDIWKQYAMDLDQFVLFGTAMCNKCETINVQQMFTYLFMASVIILLLLNSIITVALSILIYRELQTHKHLMSIATYKMHKTLTNILLAQTFLPIIFLLIPIFTCVGYVITNNLNDVLIQCSMAPLAMFPVLNDALFLYFSPPHKRAFINLMKFWKDKVLEISTIIVMFIKGIFNKVFL